MGTTMRLGTLLMILAVAVQVPAAQGPTAITNEDVIKMVQAKLATTIIMTTIESSHPKFDLTADGLIALKTAGVGDEIVAAMQARTRAITEGTATTPASRTAPEKSELLADSKDPEIILRTFKTLFVNAQKATYFGSQQMTAALGKNKDFATLRITIVDDSSVADVVLDVGYTFAWDYPFTLKHQNTSMILLSGKGSGPFSGPKGATSVASELVKGLRPHRLAAPAAKK